MNFKMIILLQIFFIAVLSCNNVQAKQTGITNLLQDLKDAGLKLKDLKTEQSTLEKIFVSLVKDKNEN